jgi:hypothetical protein
MYQLIGNTLTTKAGIQKIELVKDRISFLYYCLVSSMVEHRTEDAGVYVRLID